MGSKFSKRYTEEFKRGVIALVDSSGRTVTEVARETGVSPEALRGWYKRAKADRGEGATGHSTRWRYGRAPSTRPVISSTGPTAWTVRRRPA
ncbi:transposase [Streptomyces sp. JNUCC 63]